MAITEKPYNKALKFHMDCYFLNPMAITLAVIRTSKNADISGASTTCRNLVNRKGSGF